MKYFLIVVLITLSTCNSKISYYHGFIYDYDNNKPLENLKVGSQLDSNISCYTDENGYFKINDKEALKGNLIVYKKNKPIDTIVTVWSQHGEKLVYSFNDKKNDTLFIKF